MLQKLGKNLEDLNAIEDNNGPTPAKICNIESSSSKNLSRNSNLPKQLIKDLRVKVERLISDGHNEVQIANDAANKKGYASRANATTEEKQVPHLSVAANESPREISSTCLQGLKKEGSQEDMVTSSCQEPRWKCVHIQTEQMQVDGLPAKVKF